MELSKKAAYLKGLMAGLKISSDTPEGQVLLYIGELLEQMADEIEENSYAVNAVTDYIDELEDGGDPFDDIDTYEYGFDPESGEDGSEESEDVSAQEKYVNTAGTAQGNNGRNTAENELFSTLLNNITSNPDYTDKDIDVNSSLVDTLKSMMSSRLAENPEPLADNSDSNGYEEFYDEDDEVADDDTDENVFGMKCPFCHSDITFTDKDIMNSEFECPVCGNRLTIMM